MLVDPEPRQVALPLTGAVGLPAGAGVALPSNSPETLLEAGRQLWRAVRDPLLRGDVNVPPVLVARLRNTGTASFDAVTGVLVLEGALLPEDLEEPLILQALAAAAGGRSVTLQLVGPASPSPRAPGESRGPSGVDSSPDVRSPEERWAADREFLVSKGVPEERLRRLEYDMLGASHCEVCQMLALEQSDAAAATA
ncbi:MAG: hypothetical protein JOZ87_37885 [Chloroflexi bacterium]|nr:hypothetical protein [Chloroflexota bacterium]